MWLTGIYRQQMLIPASALSLSACTKSIIGYYSIYSKLEISVGILYFSYFTKTSEYLQETSRKKCFCPGTSNKYPNICFCVEMTKCQYVLVKKLPFLELCKLVYSKVLFRPQWNLCKRATFETDFKIVVNVEMWLSYKGTCHVILLASKITWHVPL